MDDIDREGWLVLGTFGISLVAVFVGYIFAWKSKRVIFRKTGALITAAVAGFAGFVMTMWLLGAVLPLPPPDGSSIWGPLLVLLVFSPLPFGAFYICAKYIREAYRQGPSTNVPSEPPL